MLLSSAITLIKLNLLGLIYLYFVYFLKITTKYMIFMPILHHSTFIMIQLVFK